MDIQSNVNNFYSKIIFRTLIPANEVSLNAPKQPPKEQLIKTTKDE